MNTVLINKINELESKLVNQVNFQVNMQAEKIDELENSFYALQDKVDIIRDQHAKKIDQLEKENNVLLSYIKNLNGAYNGLEKMVDKNYDQNKVIHNLLYSYAINDLKKWINEARMINVDSGIKYSYCEYNKSLMIYKDDENKI